MCCLSIVIGNDCTIPLRKLICAGKRHKFRVRLLCYSSSTASLPIWKSIAASSLAFHRGLIRHYYRRSLLLTWMLYSKVHLTPVRQKISDVAGINRASQYGIRGHLVHIALELRVSKITQIILLNSALILPNLIENKREDLDEGHVSP